MIQRVSRTSLVALLVLLWSALAAAETKLYVRTDSTAGGNGSECRTDGGNRSYATLQAAINALPTTLTDQYTIEICNPSGAPKDTTGIQQASFDQATTATNYLLIKTDANNRAQVPVDETRYILECTNPTPEPGCLYNNLPDHFRVDGLQIVLKITDGDDYVGLKGSNGNQTASDVDTRLTNNVVKCDRSGPSGSDIGIESRFPSGGATASGVNYVVNNFVYGCRTGFDSDWNGSRIFNNTAYFVDFAFSGNSGTIFKNNYSFVVAGGNGWPGTYGVDDTHNASNDGTHPTTNGKTCTPTWADEGYLNLRIQSGDTCLKDSGTNDPQGSGLFNNDFDGIARSGTWDIGADEYVVSVALGGTTTANIIETDIVSGGKTTTLTVSGGTFHPTSRTGIQYVGGQGAGFAGTTTNQTITFNLTNGLATTPAAGDLVIVTFCTGSVADRTLDIETTGATNYTLIGSELYSNDTEDTNMRVAYRFMPGTPETQFRFAGGSGDNADAGRWSVHVYRGVDSGTPLDVAAVTVSAAAQSTRLVNPGAITPTTAGAWLQISGCGAGAAGGTYTTNYLKDIRAGSTADTHDALIATGYREWTSGEYDPAVYTGGGTDNANDSYAAVTIALRPTVTTPFTDQRVALQQGCDGSGSGGTEWDATVKANAVAGSAVLTSSTVATITWPPEAAYNISAQETITCTVPAAILSGAGAVVATPTFTIDTGGGAPAPNCLRSLLGVGCEVLQIPKPQPKRTEQPTRRLKKAA